MKPVNINLQQKSRALEIEYEDGAVFHKALPQVAQLEKAESTFRSYLTEFGLTPSARAKLKTEEPDDKDDPLSKYGV